MTTCYILQSMYPGESFSFLVYLTKIIIHCKVKSETRTLLFVFCYLHEKASDDNQNYDIKIVYLCFSAVPVISINMHNSKWKYVIIWFWDLTSYLSILKLLGWMSWFCTYLCRTIEIVPIVIMKMHFPWTELDNLTIILFLTVMCVCAI